MTTERLHYTMCGLDDVYLTNGFEYKETPRGRRLHIFDQEGLHKAIGAYLVRQSRGLTGRELRFLREELDLSQTTLARWIGESDQSVARREKREKPYTRPSAQERLIRFLYEESIIGNHEKLSCFLKALSDADNTASDDATFENDIDHQWRRHVDRQAA